MRSQTVVSDGEKGETKKGEKVFFFGGGGERHGFRGREFDVELKTVIGRTLCQMNAV